MEKRIFVDEYISTSMAITLKYDLLTSALYGLIWSKCGLAKRVCCASETTLGKELGYKRQTISGRIKKLEEANLIFVNRRSKYKNGGRVLYITCNERKLKELVKEMSSELKRIRENLPDDILVENQEMEGD